MIFAGSAHLLSRLTQRAPLVFPLLAAYAPEAFCAGAGARGLLCGAGAGARGLLCGAGARGLHVFARTGAGAEFVKVAVPASADACDLRTAVIAELRLDAAPNRVRLLREVKAGGAPVPLDGARTLASQRVRAGSKVLVEVLPRARAGPPPPPPAEPKQQGGAPPAAPLASFPNVLACAPDGAHSPPLLRLLSSPGTEALQRVRALSQLLLEHSQRHPSAQDDLPLPLLETQAHLALLSTLVHHASQLASGAFVGLNGAPCRTLVGARGIGKTTLLRAFSLVAASAFPTVIVLYVTGAGLSDPCSSFHAAGLPSLLEAAAAARGADLEAHGGSSGINDALRARSLRLLLVVDEVDELYRVSPLEPEQSRHVRQTLGRLGSLGDGFSGLYGVLLCGSSSSTHSLVCGGAPGLGDWFPLIKQGVPDLNGTKYKRLLVPSSQCTAVGEVARMLAALAREPSGELPARLLPHARLLTFFVGASPRAVLGAARAQPEAALASATQAPSPRLSRQALALYHALLARLLERNGALRAHVRNRDDGTVNLVSLMDSTAPWEDLLVPLTWAEVEAVWGACAGAASSDAGLLRHLVHELTDHQLFQLRGPYMGGETLWPATAAQVAASEKEGSEWAREAAPRLVELMNMAGAFLKVARHLL